MLNYFDPKELGLRTGATFSPRDVATFKDLGVAFLRTANECLSKFKNHSIEDRVGFISGMGWSSTGMWVEDLGRGDIDTVCLPCKQA